MGLGEGEAVLDSLSNVSVDTLLLSKTLDKLFILLECDGAELLVIPDELSSP